MNEIVAQFATLNGTIIKTMINLAALREGRSHPYETIAYTKVLADGWVVEVYETVDKAESGHLRWLSILRKA